MTSEETVRVAIITDVHSNLAALEAVLAHAEERRALDEIWSMGDLVGYGPQPGDCLTLLGRYPFTCVVGNHDLAAIGDIDTDDFNPEAAYAAAWTGAHLTDEQRRFLRELPQMAVRDPITLVHGSLRYPAWEYMFSTESALAQFERQETLCSFVGHTHVPLVFEEAPGQAEPLVSPLSDGDIIDLGERRLIVNPGGLGQPRDGDPRAPYAIFDSEERTISLHRVPYDIARTQAIMAEVGLPERLIRRLAAGR